ncbi:MAG: radical SAM protein [Polyangiales bacterium]
MILSASGSRATIEGSLCAEVEASLAQGAPTPALLRLAPAHESLQELAGWLATPSVPLTALDIVRLDGFDTLFLELLGRCNERCLHCYADAAPTVTDALDRATALSVIEQARALGFRRIQLTGGDPLLSEYLPEAVRHAREVGIEHVEIYTNGLALTDELLAELAPARPAFAFSIYSADPEAHDRITRTPGSHRRTLAAIDRVVARELPVRCAVIVVDHATDVDALTELLTVRGVPEISVSRTFAVGRGTEHAVASQELVVAAHTISGGGHRATNAQSDGKLCVTYTGDVVPCIFQRASVLGNVRDGSLLELLTAPLPRPASRGLPLAEEVGRRLQCTTCRVTDVGLALLRGAR